ncbi:MAG: beta strand repeat-containing protein [Lentimicrobium sp.]
MKKHFKFTRWLALILLLFGSSGAMAQDQFVCPGEQTYWVDEPDGTPGSTYTWTVDPPIAFSFPNPPYTNRILIDWPNPGATFQDYTITVTEFDGSCYGEPQVIVVRVNPLPDAPIVGLITQPTCLVATGSVVLEGLPTGDWTINPGAITGSGSTYTVTGLATGTYNFTVTNDEGCISAASLDVVIDAQPITPDAPIVGLITQPTCLVATGSVVLEGLPTGDWTINPGAITGSGSTYTVTGLATGTYNFTVTNDEGCISAASLDVVIDAQPITPDAPIVGLITQPTCLVATGSVVLEGLPTGDWTINPGAITGSGSTYTVTGLATGTYNFTVTNDEGCISAASLDVVIDAQPITPDAPIVGLITQPTCLVATGSVVLEGLPTGDWTINPGAITGSGSTYTVTGLATGTYNFTVTNDEGCISAASLDVVIDAQPITPDAPIVGLITQPTCLVATGSVVLEGLPTGDWTINPGAITGSGSTYTVTGLATGTYNFTVTNDEGCISAASLDVVIDAQPVTPDAPIVGLITQPTCLVATGSVVLEGLPTGDWTINPGAITGSGSTYTVTGLATGTYNFTVTNDEGCISAASLDVVIDAQPITPDAPIVGLITQPTCLVATGSVVLEGLPTGDWTINPGAITGSGSTYTVTGLATGTYNFTVTNDEGCISAASLDVVIDAQPITPDAPIVGLITQPTCLVATGSVVLEGLPTGDWTINPGAITGSGSTYTVTGLATGTYNFTVTNDEGCISAASLDVVIDAQPITPDAPIVGLITQPTCLVATGSVVLEGLPTGDWTINPGAITGSGSTYTVTGLATGTYNFTVTNDEGCISAASLDVVIDAQPITPDAPIVGLITQPTCLVATGSVVLEGLPTGDWTINPGAITGSGSTYTVTGLATGTYNFTVTNDEGCISTASLDVVIDAQPITPDAPIVGLITQPTCLVATGSVVLEGLPTGDWTINPGAITGSGSTYTVTGLATGTYNFTVTNDEGCISAASLDVVIDAQPITPDAPIVGLITQPTCLVATGSVVLEGLPTGDWTINPGAITGSGSTYTVTGLATGTYNFTVTNDEGCISAASLDVVIDAQPITPDAPIVGLITQPTCLVATGSVVLEGLPTGDWTINPGAITGSGSTYTVTGLATGTYNFTVTNDEGCISTASLDVVIDAQPITPDAPIVGLITQPTCLVATGSVVLEGLPTGDWTINPGAITGSGSTYTVTGLATGTYNFTVTNDEGCISAASLDVVIDAQPPTPTPVIDGLDIVCQNDEEVYTVTLNSGNTYEWTVVGGTFTGQGTNQITVTWTTPTSGSVTVEETLGGCTGIDTLIITINAAPPTSTILHN